MQEPKNCKGDGQCQRELYKDDFCKYHFFDYLAKRVKREIRLMYRNPELAFAALDLDSCGMITKENFISHQIVKKLKFEEEEMLKWFSRDHIFPVKEGKRGLNFLEFKKKFFPRLFQIDEVTIGGEAKVKSDTKEDIVQRIRNLEENLQKRFQNNWVSVRKAFLDLDYDHDGSIDAKDIIRYLGHATTDINLDDLNKLIMEKDSTKQGLISYADFSRWMGCIIQQSEGFYFRHDSIRNPVYEENKVKSEVKKCFFK